jgi:hypothetical protein
MEGGGVRKVRSLTGKKSRPLRTAPRPLSITINKWLKLLLLHYNRPLARITNKCVPLGGHVGGLDQPRHTLQDVCRAVGRRKQQLQLRRWKDGARRPYDLWCPTVPHDSGEAVPRSHTGGALITRVLIPAVLIPNQLKMRTPEKSIGVGAKNSTVGMGWILILESDHISPWGLELVPRL